MRLALISDIHGNATALEAVLADIRRQRVEAVVCLGDIATLGPQPKRVLELLANLECLCIMGNHDAALFEPATASQFRIPPNLIASLEWCAAQLAPSDFEFLQTCLGLFAMPVGLGTSLLCCHGSPKSNTDMILASTPSEELEALLAGQCVTLMAGGHTHIQMLRQHNRTRVINPGSVGSAFLAPVLDTSVPPTLLPWAEYAVLEVNQHAANVDFRRVAFSIPNFLRLLDQTDLPIKNWWHEQYIRHV